MYITRSKNILQKGELHLAADYVGSSYSASLSYKELSGIIFKVAIYTIKTLQCLPYYPSPVSHSINIQDT